MYLDGLVLAREETKKAFEIVGTRPEVGELLLLL